MKNYGIVALLTFLLSNSALIAQCGNLIWQDEFNTASVDNAKWTVQTGNGCPGLCGWGNNELQNYSASSDNVRMEGGNLVLEARNNGGNYTSGRLTTQGKFSRRYGRYEIKAKLPSGTGLWPAFWMLSNSGNWPRTGEIDIMEFRGDIINRNTGTLHYGDFVPNNRNDGTDYLTGAGNLTDDFHVYAIEWDLGQIRWYVDGNLYKTETKTPNSLNPVSNNAAWPWDDSDFYIILNLAVGGVNTPFTGNQNPNFGSNGRMLVDYVRVYDAAQPQINMAGKARVFQNTITTYSVPAGTNQNYTWTVPSGATITGGQSTRTITVNWGTSTGGDVRVDIQHVAGALCPGKTFFYTKAVSVYKNNCAFTFHNYEGFSTMSAGTLSGQLTEVNNPGVNAVNNSTRSGRYIRNGAELYDALYYDNALLDNGPQYVAGTYVIKMDVRTDAPVGTQVLLQVGSSANWGAYPAGIHSVYAATTTATNQWQTLTFAYTNSPDAGGGAAYQNNLDRLVFLFRPNTNTNNTYFIDNVRREHVPTPSTLSITGSQAAALNETGVAYSVTGGNVASPYLWSVPVGATIASGANTNAIGVNFGVLGGFIAVQERMAAGCYGPTASKAISVGGNSCALFSDEYDNLNTSTWIQNSPLNGFVHSEVVSDWRINSPGHGEWDYTQYTINDGTAPVLLDFTNPLNNPVMKIRARSSAQMFMRVTLVDVNGNAAANNFLAPLNGFVVNTTTQEYTIDFNGQMWDEYSGGGQLDISRIAKIRISLNPGFASFPPPKPGGGTFNAAFVGDVYIDYIRIGNDCPTAIANFSANDLVLCGVGTNVTFTDISNNTTGATTYAWNFGAGATPATANTKGPHVVSYNTAGWKTITMNIDGGASTRTRTDYVYVSPANTGCVFDDQYADNVVNTFTTPAGNFTLTESASAFHITTTAHGEWETLSQGFNSGAVAMPIDFSCFQSTVKVRAKASSPVALRIALADNANRLTNNAATVAQTMELTTSYQDFTLSFFRRFTDQYSAGGPFNVDSSDIRKMVFSVNAGFASSPWNGPTHGLYNSSFNGTVDIEYALVGNCPTGLPIDLLSFTGEALAEGNLLSWNANGNVLRYEVQFLESDRWETLTTLNVTSTSYLDETNSVRTYRLRLVDTDGVISYSNAITIGSDATELTLFPVPAEDVIVANFNATQAEYRLMNAVGETLIVQHENHFDLQHIPAGTYMIQVIGNGIIRVKTFVKY